MPAAEIIAATTRAVDGEANRASYPTMTPRWGSSYFKTYDAIAPATRRTFSKVKSSAIMPRQPSVPNLISCPMTLGQLVHFLFVQILHNLADILRLLPGGNQ